MYIKPLCCCWQRYELLQVVMLISLSILANTRAFQNGFTDRANSGRADVKNWADSCRSDAENRADSCHSDVKNRADRCRGDVESKADSCRADV